MTLRIRQIVLAARDLRATVAQLETVLGETVCYRDPLVGHFGLENALFTIGHEGGVQFLEVVSPVKESTTAGRHLDRHGDSGYMLILQTDDLARDRERLARLGVRIVWESVHSDIAAVHLHPKDIGAAIVSLDQATPYDSWRWAGPEWRKHVSKTGAQRVLSVTVGAQDPVAMARRWSAVLDAGKPIEDGASCRIGIDEGELRFERATSDVIAGFEITIPNPQTALRNAQAIGLPIDNESTTICGVRFVLRALN